MIEKSLTLPVFSKRTVRRKLSLFRDESGSLSCAGLHFREEEGKIVCAEGAEEISAFPAGGTLFSSCGHAKTPFLGKDGTLVPLPSGESLGGVSLPGEMILYRTETEEIFFFLTKEGLFRFRNGMAERVPSAAGGTCGCISGERLMTASSDVVRWSMPLSPENWEGGILQAGSLCAQSSEGKILALLPYDGKTYLFRERGINALTVRGDALDFRLESIPVPFARLREGTVRECGGKIAFLAEDGLYLFDGNSAKRISGMGYSEIEDSLPIRTAALGSVYYAAVTLKNGERAIWAADVVQQRGHFLRVQAEEIAAGEEIYFAAEGKLFRICGRDVPLSGRRECTLWSEPSLLGLSAQKKYLDAVTIEGKGTFFVEARAERGASRAAAGRAGERLRFPAPVFGTSFSFGIRSGNENARIDGLVFEIREETGEWK